VVAEIAACSEEAKVWQRNWLLVGSGMAAGMTVCIEMCKSVTVKLAALSKDAKCDGRNRCLMKEMHLPRIAACWIYDHSRCGIAHSDEVDAQLEANLNNVENVKGCE